MKKGIDRAKLDQYLFSLLSAWSKELIESGSSQDVALAESLIERSEHIPGVSVQQRREIRSIKADLSLSAAKRLILESQEIVKAAERELRDATSVESRFELEAKQWMNWTRHVLKLFEGGPALTEDKPQPANDQKAVQDLPSHDHSSPKLKQNAPKEESGNSKPKQENTVQSNPQSFDL